ncbi:glycoside hydrolase family 127 protein [Bifidobacterium platyrrhinorum]|uniref:Glycoside hydrolase family 127 protein n=1 Tax=Bifidobacterium platyrrhinorum TaxID=2661628 RepID=A0A6L9SR65_9BIFI|nr:beta-L-arabinofuranosidase domain-containing protein [Bifidobacterium platyrrhinorum]NEG54243.1 glycoside hydrolase family 127 protein [Bifidobacterium platyrrhinorum]
MISLNTSPTVDITSGFWRNYRNLVVDKVLPYQWAVMADEQSAVLPDDPSSGNSFEGNEGHTLRNIEIAAGLVEGHHTGYQFQDSDLYKWLEAAAYALAYRHDDHLRETADRLVDLIAKAQAPDGYLVTLFQIDWPQERFKRLRQSHELYTMGHYIEAAVAYYEVTGNTTALNVACRMADCIDANFGDEEGKIHGVDGHPEIEVALPRLYEATGERRYLDLARFFLHERGRNPDFFDEQFGDGGSGCHMLDVDEFARKYYQIDRPFTGQTTAEGHAVRVVYLCEGAAHVARLTGDEELREAAERLWRNIVRQRMYITGQVGSTHEGEAFTADYDLPNDTMYGESCASVGMAMFARRLLEIEPHGEYADVLEKQLFNGAISGMSLDGSHFYYVNPLEADPVLSARNPDKKHVLTHRAEWFGCSCCPANIARLVASVDRYLYTVHGDTIYAHQFIANTADFGHGIGIEQRGDYPWDGHIEYTVRNLSGEPFRFAVHIPEWSANDYKLTVDGKACDKPVEDGFVVIEIAPGHEDRIVRLDLDMRVKAMEASSRVRVDAGKVAFMRGPVVFCAEAADNAEDLWRYHVPREVRLDADARTEAAYESGLLGGVETITVPARVRGDDEAEPLYHEVEDARMDEATLKLVPYYAWANREDGQMSVWLN